MRFIILFACGLIGLLANQATAQNRVYSITVDSLQPTSFPLVQPKRIIKAGIVLPLLRQSSVSSSVYWKTVALDVMLERKVTKNVALVVGLENHYLFGRYAQLYSLELPLGARYYFSIGKKMKRTNPTGFFRHYIAFQTYNVVFADLVYDLPNPSVERYYRGQRLNRITNGGKYQEAFNLVQNAYFQVGTQLKLPKTKYLDLNIGIPVSALVYTKREYTLASPALINIKYGIAWQK